MKISLEWLRDYVSFDKSPQEIAQILTNQGLTVEGIEPAGSDFVLNVEVTSNRPDCLAHIGIAREIAAATGTQLRLPDVSFNETGKDVNLWTSVTNDAPALCSRYTARIIDQLTVAPSPDWMARRLEAVGIRAISNVVDITNYIMMEIGQPLHSFDYQRLEGGKIVVRRAKPGEQITTIDQSKLELKPSMLVIADESQPVALAGVMGGLASEVTPQTRTVLLESAHFDPLCIRSTARSLSMGSESSFRFERNVDVVMLEWASRRAAALLQQFAGGKVAPGVVDTWPVKPPSKTASMRLSRLKLLLGIEVETNTVLNILTRLGFAPQYDNQNTITCTIPSWRSDVEREADLIEEVIRIHGFGHIPTEQKIHISVTTVDSYQRCRQRVTNTLHGCGYFETISVGFIDEKYWPLFAEPGFSPVRIRDESRKDNALRHSLLPSLMLVQKRNQDAGNEAGSFYELAAAHLPAGKGELPKETILLGMVTAGEFRSLRGVLEAVVAAVDKNAVFRCEPAEVIWAEPGTGAKVMMNEVCLGTAGEVRKEILKQYDLQTDAYAAELDFSGLVGRQSTGAAQMQQLMRFPGITRDLSLVLSESVRWSEIEHAIRSLSIQDLRTVNFVDIYRGKGVEAGKKSLTLSMEFRREQETLTHEQVDSHQALILNQLEKQFGAKLRE